MSEVDNGTCPGEEGLVLYLLGEPEDRAAIEPHLEACVACRAEVGRIRELLAAAGPVEVPAPDAGFEARIWERQRCALEADGRIGAGSSESLGADVVRPAFWSMRRLALLGAVAASLVVAFLLGLYTPPPGTEPVPEGEAAGDDRILLIAVGGHLERSRMVLLELVNASDANAMLAQRDQAQRLVADNRLYRQTARIAGQTVMADVLDELERVLLELAQSPDSAGADELEWLRRRVADRDLLFKVKVIEGNVRQGAGSVRIAGLDL